MYMLHTCCFGPESEVRESLLLSSLVVQNFITKIWFIVDIVTYEVLQNMSHDG